jgi:cell division protein FtsN
VRDSKGSSKLDVTIKLGLVLFVSLLSFAVGTFVGKKFSDNQHKLAQYEGKAASEVASQEVDSAGSIAATSESGSEYENKDALSDEEIARLAEEFVSEESAPKEVKADSPARAVASVPETKASVPETKKAEATATPSPVAASESTAEKSKVMDSTPAPQPTSAKAGKFTVQIASHSNQTEAEKLSASLKDKGLTAFIIPAKINNQTWYRVNVGVYASSAQAKESQKDLDKKGIKETLVQKLIE